MTYAPLHMHSHYSLLDSNAKIKDMVARAKELGIPAMALVDHGTASGALAFYKECKKQGIKPLLGSELYVAKRHRTQKEGRALDGYYHLVLIAMNSTGWANLCKLITEGFRPEHYYYKPRVDRELLAKYNEGLIALSACIGGNVPKAIMRELNLEFIDQEGSEVDTEDAESYMDVINWHRRVFGDRFYIEIQRHGMSVEFDVNNRLVEASRAMGIKLVATTDSHYVHKEDKLAHNILLTIGNGREMSSESVKAREYEGDGYYMFPPEEMYSLFRDVPEAVQNTLEIAERCDLEFNFGDLMLPHVVDSKIEDQVFREEVIRGLHNRFGEVIPDDVMERAEAEMTTIIQMTYPSYFLIVSDYVRAQKKNGNLIGPGRGSAAGSIVSYALDITDVNPIEYGLSFARFLNKGRAAIPQVNFEEFTLQDFKAQSGGEHG